MSRHLRDSGRWADGAEGQATRDWCWRAEIAKLRRMIRRVGVSLLFIFPSLSLFAHLSLANSTHYGTPRRIPSSPPPASGSPPGEATALLQFLPPAKVRKGRILRRQIPSADAANRRKCDRQRPCSHCIVGYPKGENRGGCESLWCNTSQKRHLESTCTYTDSSSPSSESRQLHADPSATYDSSPSASGLGGIATPSSSASIPSPEATDLHLTRSGTGFKDSTHWTTVLSGVTETGDPVPAETAFGDGSSPLDQTVLLFEGCKRATQQALLDALPPRRKSDALVAFYFRAQEYRCTQNRWSYSRIPADSLSEQL